MKFTRFLEDEKRTPTGIDVQTAFAPKVYHTKREMKITRIALIIAVAIIILSVIINLICFPFMISEKKVNTSIGDIVYLDGLATEVDHRGNPSLAYQDPNKEPLYDTMPICSTKATFKSWMDYRKITNTTTRQWKYRNLATTDENGFRRIDDYYMVAMAKMYGPVGTKYYITFSGGASIYAMMGDLKGATKCQHPDTSMLEFIIDLDTLLPIVRKSGNVNKVFEGTIVEIRIIK